MGEPAEIGPKQREQARAWATRLIEMVRADEAPTWAELLGDGALASYDATVYAQLVLAQVIADSISREALIEMLEREQFDASAEYHDVETRHGWNMSRRNLIRRLKAGEL